MFKTRVLPATPFARHGAFHRVLISSVLVAAALVATLAMLATCALVANAATVRSAVNNWTGVLQFGMYGNATLNDCSIAAIATLEQVWGKESGGTGTALAESPIADAYESLVHGANPGVLPAQAFTAWKQGIGGLKIASVNSLSPSQASVESAILQLGGIYAIVNLTGNDAQHPGVPTALAPTTAAWTLGESRQLGAFAVIPHAVAVVGYDSEFVYLATWGSIQPVTWAWWNARVVQTWAILPESFVSQGHGPTSSVSTIEQEYFHAPAPSAQDGPYAT